MSERDTKFQGFAKLVIDEVYANGPQTIQTYEQIIAQRAYDLAYHVLYETSMGMDRVFGIPYRLENVPDLTSWPEQT